MAVAGVLWCHHASQWLEMEWMGVSRCSAPNCSKPGNGHPDNRWPLLWENTPGPFLVWAFPLFQQPRTTSWMSFVQVVGGCSEAGTKGPSDHSLHVSTQQVQRYSVLIILQTAWKDKQSAAHLCPPPHFLVCSFPFGFLIYSLPGHHS